MAVDVAERLGGVVINTDSMQVYSGLRVLTARPDDAECARVPHRLYGHIDPAERYSVGRFARDAATVLADCEGAGRVPVFVGGTGLYFQVLLEGLSPIPDVPDRERALWDGQLANEGVDALRDVLRQVDPALAQRFPMLDGQRLVRALSVHGATGKPLSAWQDEPGVALLDAGQCARVFLDPDRDRLRTRIDARFVNMVAGGAVEEVAALSARLSDTSLPAMRAHGVPHIAAHLRGEITLDEAVERGQGDTRRYAKRQRTWFRNQMTDWHALDPDNKKARVAWLTGLDG